MIPVIIESPYAGDVKRNMKYLKLCIKDCLNRNEAPFASHLLYTDVLNDNIKQERDLGINAGFVWGKLADKVVVYINYGISKGMQYGVQNALKNNKLIEYRRL